MNYYQLLQVEVTASTQQIKQAYRRLAKEFHPDSQHQNANHETIVQLNTAYKILSDPQNRSKYDRSQALDDQDNYYSTQVQSRQAKNSWAENHYRQTKEKYQSQETSQSQWLSEVYAPIYHMIEQIINPLEDEIEELSGDLFDDELMGVFVEYLEESRRICLQAENTLRSQPNPSLYAGIAAYIYYGLNHINDGIEELERFTMTYEESYLYAGRELFNLAVETTELATEMVQRFV